LKKVIAKGVTWTMGSIMEYGRFAQSEAPHRVTLDHNYYLGVFPATQRQCQLMYGENGIGGREGFAVDGDMRIRGNADYHGPNAWNINIRGKSFYPAAPAENSLLGNLRERVANSVDFDLPSEAEWEYACRAGTYEGYWNDGSRMEATATEYKVDSKLPGRYRNNQADPDNIDFKDCGPENGTPIAGSYAPNGWGFYDVHGGVWERCLDWYQEDITHLNGAVNANGENRLDGTAGVNMVIRGGAWCVVACDCRAARRGATGPAYWGERWEYGFRVACRADLK
jgi:formylglycine-generating enzyme required for sulfatase activity